MSLGKMTLVLDYSPQRINRDIPAFHRELLIARHKHKGCHIRTSTPESLTDVLNEPLFLNELIVSQEKPLTQIGMPPASLELKTYAVKQSQVSCHGCYT